MNYAFLKRHFYVKPQHSALKLFVVKPFQPLIQTQAETTSFNKRWCIEYVWNWDIIDLLLSVFCTHCHLLLSIGSWIWSKRREAQVKYKGFFQLSHCEKRWSTWIFGKLKPLRTRYIHYKLSRRTLYQCMLQGYKGMSIILDSHMRPRIHIHSPWCNFQHI